METLLKWVDLSIQFLCTLEEGDEVLFGSLETSILLVGEILAYSWVSTASVQLILKQPPPVLNVEVLGSHFRRNRHWKTMFQATEQWR